MVTEVHTGEKRTISESVVANALEERQVRKADRLKRFAFLESTHLNCTQGTDTREVHTGEMRTLSKSIVANAFDRQVRKADRSKRLALPEGASPYCTQGYETREVPHWRDAHTQGKPTSQCSRATAGSLG